MIYLEKLVKRTVGVGMSVLLTVSMIPAPVYAREYADDELIITVDNGVVTVNGNEEETPINRSEDISQVYIGNGFIADETSTGCQLEVSIGDVAFEGSRYSSAIAINNYRGEDISTDFQSGNVTSNSSGINISSFVGNVTASVGDINAENTGAYVGTLYGDATLTTGSVQSGKNGVYVCPDEGTETTVTTGDIQAGNNGLIVRNEGGNATVASGSIVANDCGIIEIGEKGDSDTNIEVNGNVTAGEGLFELDSDIYGIKSGIATYSKAGNTGNIKVNGDVTGSMGIFVVGDSSQTDMTIDGNVSGFGATFEEMETHIPGVGIVYYNSDDPKGNGDDKLSVLVTDTVSGSEDGVGVVTSDDGLDFTLTTWKIIPSTDKFAAGENIVAAKPADSEEYEFVENEEFEKSIQYIIKIDPAEVAGVSSLGATKEDGSALDKEGDYEWAHEGDTLLLKVELQDGYELTNAYGKENQSYPFTKDQSGNYYITVPRGGGIFISVETALKPVDPDEPVDPDQPVDPDEPVDPEQPVSPVVNVEVVDDESSNDNPPTVQGAVANADTLDPVIFNSSIIRMVTDAAPGANVTVAAAGNTMISKEVVDTLIVRSDVSLTITYVIDGVMYSVTIPAGADLNSYRNAAGGIDIFTLVQLFGAAIVG